jgi:hypothetical protein
MGLRGVLEGTCIGTGRGCGGVRKPRWRCGAAGSGLGELPLAAKVEFEEVFFPAPDGLRQLPYPFEFPAPQAGRGRTGGVVLRFALSMLLLSVELRPCSSQDFRFR